MACDTAVCQARSNKACQWSGTTARQRRMLVRPTLPNSARPTGDWSSTERPHLRSCFTIYRSTIAASIVSKPFPCTICVKHIPIYSKSTRWISDDIGWSPSASYPRQCNRLTMNSDHEISALTIFGNDSCKNIFEFCVTASHVWASRLLENQSPTSRWESVTVSIHKFQATTRAQRGNTFFPSAQCTNAANKARRLTFAITCSFQYQSGFILLYAHWCVHI